MLTVYPILHTMKKGYVKTVLKHLFVPHKENDYKPHFFREHIMLSLLIGSILLLILSYTSYKVIHTTRFGSEVVVSVLVDLTNRARETEGLPPLRSNQKLETAATLKGYDMAERNYFSHYAPDGTSPWYWFKEAQYSFIYAGENLAVNFRSSDDVENAWLNSPKHRENILNPHYEDIGIATVQSSSTNAPTLFVVQLFGKQAPQSQNATSSWPPTAPHTAHLYEKLLFNSQYYIYEIYIILLLVIGIALAMMIFIEIRTQHYLHIIYGVLLGLVVILCICINTSLL